MRTISIAEDFSVFPGGRSPEDGDFSGQEFRETFLVPVLEQQEQVIIDFDNARGYGSSFLEEAFGGLIRRGFSKECIVKSFKLRSSKSSITEEVMRYINAAECKHNES